MGTRPFEEPKETAAVKVTSGIREAIAGHPDGAVRRIVLYIVAFVAFTLAAFTPLGLLAFIVGAVSIYLLIGTDQLA